MSTAGNAGSCLVCGALANLRCSACATTSHLDLFFCSKEHQSLIWPFHRLVCGERAHPFALPPYSQEEADMLIERLRTPVNSPELESSKKYLLKSLGLAPTDFSGFNALVKSAVGKGGQIVPSSLRKTSGGQEDALVIELRCMNYCWTSETTTAWSELMRDPIEYFNYTYDKLTRKAPKLPADHFTSQFCHHLAATIPLACTLVKALEGNPAGDKHIPLAQVKGMQGASDALAAVTAATDATGDFLMTADTYDHVAFAEAVLPELFPSRGGAASVGEVFEVKEGT